MAHSVKGDLIVGRDLTVYGTSAYAEDKIFSDDKELVSKKYVDNIQHNDILGLQGGISGSEYYHLSQEQYDNLGVGGMEWIVISSGTTALPNTGYLIDATLSNINLTLDSSPTVGDVVGFSDYLYQSSNNMITILRNYPGLKVVKI